MAADLGSVLQWGQDMPHSHLCVSLGRSQGVSIQPAAHAAVNKAAHSQSGATALRVCLLPREVRVARRAGKGHTPPLTTANESLPLPAWVWRAGTPAPDLTGSLGMGGKGQATVSKILQWVTCGQHRLCWWTGAACQPTSTEAPEAADLMMCTSADACAPAFVQCHWPGSITCTLW
jgi:hypothetical protein